MSLKLTNAKENPNASIVITKQNSQTKSLIPTFDPYAASNPPYQDPKLKDQNNTVSYEKWASSNSSVTSKTVKDPSVFSGYKGSTLTDFEKRNTKYSTTSATMNREMFLLNKDLDRIATSRGTRNKKYFGPNEPTGIFRGPLQCGGPWPGVYKNCRASVSNTLRGIQPIQRNVYAGSYLTATSGQNSIR